MFSVYLYGKKKGIKFLTIADAISPGLILGYGIGRIGCHLAGDGDYGFPTTLPWGTNYSNGTYPPSVAFRDFPEITGQFPGGIVPDNILCHPTPVYEFIICALICWFLWSIRKKTTADRQTFYDLLDAGRYRTIYYRVPSSESKIYFWFKRSTAYFTSNHRAWIYWLAKIY